VKRQRARKRPARHRQWELIVTESSEPVDVDAFCEAYARLLISQVDALTPTQEAPGNSS